jgi:hypothetical protein
MEKDTKIVGSEIIKESNPEKLHNKTQEYLFFQFYITAQFIYDHGGLEELKKFYKFSQEGFFNLKMSMVYKMMEGIIKRLPKALKIKEGLKRMVTELEFLESPKNTVILEQTSEKGGFEITKCTLRKEFNKLAKKSNKGELLDKCCLWCLESIPYAEKYGFEYRIDLTKTGCLNYIE